MTTTRPEAGKYKCEKKKASSEFSFIYLEPRAHKKKKSAPTSLARTVNSASSSSSLTVFGERAHVPGKYYALVGMLLLDLDPPDREGSALFKIPTRKTCGVHTDIL